MTIIAYAPDMGVVGWVRRIFLPGRPESDEQGSPDFMAGAPGVSPFAALEDAAAVEAVVEEPEAPSDPAS